MPKRRRPPGRAEVIEAAFHQNYPAVNYAYIQFFSEHLADCSRMFDGDLQQMLILAVIGQTYLEAYTRAGAHPEQSTAINASRLADVCGIPRQTVRRKLELLEQKNWIRQDGERSWTVAVDGDVATARLALDGLTQRAMARLAKLHATLERVASETGDPTAGSPTPPS